MSGIAGVFGEAEGDLDPLLTRMRHRGPDSQGVVQFDTGAFGHVRLATVDKDGGEQPLAGQAEGSWLVCEDRKSTRLNSSHVKISYAVFCLKKKKKNTRKSTEHK